LNLLAGHEPAAALVNQNFVVISGLTKASNTSATGLRMSIPVFVIGTCFS
jgi:hypothetical protein